MMMPRKNNPLDFYKAESATPTPVVFYIHGGGWKTGDKAEATGLKETVAEYRKAGISVVQKFLIEKLKGPK